MAYFFHRKAAGAGGVAAGAVLVFLTVAVGLSGDAGDWLGDHSFTLLTIPIALAAVRFGLRGGVAPAVLASGLATTWWLRTDEPGGVLWLTSRTLTYVLLGVALGWAIESRNALLRRLEHHNELSLDLVATASFDGSSPGPRRSSSM